MAPAASRLQSLIRCRPIGVTSEETEAGYVRTGAVDSLARSNDYLKGLSGGNRQILMAWSHLLEIVVRFSKGARSSGDEVEEDWDKGLRAEFLERVR